MHNPAKVEIQQERKRFLPSQRAACRSERMEERKTDRSMREGENRKEYTSQQCRREQKPLRPNPATSSNAKKAIEQLNTRVIDLLQ